MSAQHTTHAHGAHDHGGHDHHGDAEPHSSLRDYTIGFVLSVILTAIPFWLVMAKVIADRNTAVLVLGGFAVIQILVHMVYFLHMNGKVEGGWTMLSTIFTVVFVAIAIAGTSGTLLRCRPDGTPLDGEAGLALPYSLSCPEQAEAAARICGDPASPATPSGPPCWASTTWHRPPPALLAYPWRCC